jgi:hypothetical protein
MRTKIHPFMQFFGGDSLFEKQSCYYFVNPIKGKLKDVVALLIVEI